jgi:hypothetical protein
MKKKYIMAFLDALFIALRTTAALLLGNAVLVYHGVIGQYSQFIKIGTIGAIVLVIVSVPWVLLLLSGKDD